MRYLLLIAAAGALSGCMLLGGEHYVMSYTVGADTSMDAATFEVSISGR